jgi:hypothetical protein
MSGTGDETGFDAPALRPHEWRRSRPADVRPGPRLSRGESAAAQLIAIAEAAAPGDRLGSKEELRARCEVSVGTFNEAVRIAQSRGIISVRPGPGGGVFAATQSPMVRLGNSVLALDAEQTPVAEAVRIRDALDPLLIQDALWHASPAGIAELREILADMASAVQRLDPTALGAVPHRAAQHQQRPAGLAGPGRDQRDPPLTGLSVASGHAVTAGLRGVVSCSSFAPMSARSVTLEIFPTWVRGSASMSSRRSGHLYLARPAASR